MKITIEPNSGFCFGVVSAIERAEKELSEHHLLYCLGDIVHNSAEVDRLHHMGLKVIDTDTFSSLQNASVLIRAHGEPPATYQKAKDNKIELIDATCPIVLHLQQQVKKGFDEMQKCKGQVFIFGKAGHAEVVGLNGQTGSQAIVISHFDDLKKCRFDISTRLFSQTTMNTEDYEAVKDYIEKACQESGVSFVAVNSICSRMAKRAEQLKSFVQSQEIIFFVGDPKSSNGKYLYGICKKHNPYCFFISDIRELSADMIKLGHKKEVEKIGICGATSTPMWLMEAVAEHIQNLSC